MCVGGWKLGRDDAVDDREVFGRLAGDVETGLDEGMMNLAALGDRSVAKVKLVFQVPEETDADVGRGSDKLHVGKEDRGQGFVGQGVEVDRAHVFGGASGTSTIFEPPADASVYFLPVKLESLAFLIAITLSRFQTQ